MRLHQLVLASLLFCAPAFAAPPASLEPVLSEIGEDALFEKYEIAMQVVDLASGEEVFARDADKLLSPASTTKVVTAATALKTLGPAYRFKTEILSDARPDADGVVKGNLYVRGGGDPSMVVEKLWKMVHELELAGVKTVTGDLVFDDTFFTADTSLAGWDKEADVERGPSYFPELSALSINFNTASILVRPGPKEGGDATVQLETPAGDWIELVSTVKTGPAGSRRGIRIVREVLAEGGMRYTASGSIPADDETARYYRTVSDPTGHFAAIMGELLDERGIVVKGSKTTRGATPEAAERLALNQSNSLTALLMDMNKFSSNFFAEQVLRTIGAEVEEEPGSTECGLRVVNRYLGTLGLGEDAHLLVNGSGLARDARLSPAALNAVLVDMYKDPKVGADFGSTLAIAGWDGTLSGRLEDHAGLLRGKTGTINGVHCLSGYLSAGNGERYAFTILANKVRSTRQVRQLHDRFAETLFEMGQESVAEAPSEATE